ncbi:MAG: HPr kinase/phosphorylase [Leptonema sp. (in: Bacteria)]|nr:HPr kinase/phosphorylase [Leptonema sp. (in: bacteria)]
MSEEQLGVDVGSLLDQSELRLKCIAGLEGFKRRITSIDVNRPGLALTGFYHDFAEERIQIIGKGEFAYIADCDLSHLNHIGSGFFSFAIPTVVFTHNNQPPECFIERANITQIPILVTELSTHDFLMYYTRFITEALASSTKLHGVLLDVFGIGILLQGSSGIGKSETALELIERGHRLVADDMVELRNMDDAFLMGYTNSIIEHNMELRGIGIIDIKELFGAGAVRRDIRLDMIIQLEEWDMSQDYERLGIEDRTVDILGISVPFIVLPVRPGRNIPILIETAAMNQRLKSMGIHAGRNLSERIQKEIQKKQATEPLIDQSDIQKNKI